MFLGIAVIAALAIAVSTFLLVHSAARPSYVTVTLKRGDLTQTVTASGTINAQNTVSVGTQVSGTIQSIYVDFNDRVHTGQVLARIDPSQFQAQVNQANAALEQARAQAAASTQSALGANFSVEAANAATESADANVVRTQAALALTRHTLSRDRALLARGYIAQSQYDTDYANAVAAATAVNSAKAAVKQNTAQGSQSVSGALGSARSAEAAAAAVDSAEAVVQQDELNLQRTTISSPVDGTIVARNVSVGQTVAASFQTPTLFTIAQDLKKMEVDIAVGEPDIGNVRAGAPVAFTVLAYPTQTFHGTVAQVRVNPTTIANVVTYTVVVLVDNQQNKLLPGMTANAAIDVARVRNEFIIPTQALSYGRRAAGVSPWGSTASDVSGAVVAGSIGRVFVLRNGAPHAIPIRVDLVSGTQAAISPLRLLGAGDKIVIGDNSSAQRAPRTSANPAFGLGRVR